MKDDNNLQRSIGETVAKVTDSFDKFGILLE